MSFERTVTSRGRRYRQLVENHWDPVKKQSRTHVLRHIGPVVEDKNGRAVTAVRIEGVETACQAGHLALFFSIANEFSVRRCLEQACPDHDGRDADALLALVMNQLNGRRPLKDIGPWLDATPLGRWMNVDGRMFTKDVLTSALDSVCTTKNEITTRRVLAIQKLATDAWRKRCGPDPPRFFFYYDVTRIRYHGWECPLAENGYGPYANGRPHVGLGLVTSRGNHFPLLSFPIRGSVNDASTFEAMAAGLNVWNIDNLTIILDRGILNAKTVAHAREYGYNMLGGCSETSDEVKAALKKWPDEKIDRSTQIYLRPGNEEMYFKAWKGELFGQQGLLVLTMDPYRKIKERGARDKMLLELRNGAKKGRTRALREELGEIVRSTVGRQGWTIDEKAEDESRRADGRFLLFTTDRNMEPGEVIRAYYQRDEVEKAFRDLNGGASLGPIRYRMPDHVEPYLTVACHLAYLIRAGIAWKLRKARRPESVDQVISALREIHEVNLTTRNGVISRWTRLSKHQRKLVLALGMKKLVNSY